jgi:ERF superfamily
MQQQVSSPDAMQLIQAAISQGSSIDTVERLVKLQREMVDYAAMVDFNDAMQRAQQKMRRIGADAVNPQTKSKYASYGKLDSVLRPIYSAEGFALSFNTADSPTTDHIRILCEVSRGGYSKTYQIDMPADGKGAKGGDVMTKTHATGSATSYGMRYLLKMIFNVAVGEDDNDGNGAAKEMDLEEFDRIKTMIENAPTLAALKDIYISAVRTGTAMGDQAAVREFAKAKDARKSELDGQ